MTTVATKPKRNRKRRPPTPEAPAGEPPVLVADLFCGAGGTSTGALKAINSLGRTMRLKAINHWPVAVETHALNHPDADHYIQDVDQADPEKIVPEGYLDLLLASPECRFFSRARGGRPILDQDRMRAWTVFDWLTKLKVRVVILENVPEFRDWAPLDENDRPIRSKKGAIFQAWFANFAALGYDAQFRILNAADYGDATTRTRFFLIARNDGRPIRWPEPTHSKHGLATMYGQLPKWRGAREIIDWSNPGRSLIDDPKYQRKPLSEKTRRRIAKGLERDCGPLAPYYVPLLNLPEHQPEHEPAGPAFNGNGHHEPSAATPALPAQPPSFIINRHGENGSLRIHRTSDPCPTSTTRGAGYLLVATTTPATALGLALPEDARVQTFTMANRTENAPRHAGLPVAPITTTPGGGGICMFRAQAMPLEHQPFLLGQHSGATARSVDSPVPTVTQDGAIALIEPWLMLYYGQSVRGHLQTPLSTILGCRKHALIEPVLVQYFGQSSWSPIGRPLPAITTRDRYALASPCLVEIGHGDSRRDPRLGRNQSTLDPLRTITAKRSTGLVMPGLIAGDTALMDLAHGNRHPDHRDDARRLLDMLKPLPTVTSTAAFALATPVMEPHQNPAGFLAGPVDDEAPWAAYPELTPLIVQRGQTGGNGHYVRPVTSPAPTITTQNDLALATPFLVPNFGERADQAPRTHAIWQPLSTVTGKGACNLVVPTGSPRQAPEEIDPRRLVYVNGEPHLLDIRFRMLQNDELARAMGFEDDEMSYEFTGTATQVTKQIGNAVPVNLAAALVKAALDPGT